MTSLSHTTGRRVAAESTSTMVTTAHPLATGAGVEILERGGNAFDAAIAAAFALDLVEGDQSSAITGDGFGLFYVAETEDMVTADWSSRTPLSPDLKSQIGEIADPLGPLGLQAPTGIAGHLGVHERFGSLPLDVVLAPAIRLAENGFPVDDRLQASIARRADIFARNPQTAKNFLVGGAAPAVGDIISSPELGETMRRIAAGGREVFYRGELAAAILEFVRDHGGILTQEDLELASQAPIWSKPLHTSYRGFTVHSVPPAAGGIPLLIAMNMLEGYDLAHMPDAQRHHVMAEVFKVVLADMEHYFGDPEFSPIPIDVLLSKEFADERRRQIALDSVLPWSLPAPGAGGGSHTSHLNVRDSFGNIAVVTQTRSDWGIKVPVSGAGFFLHNGIRLLSTDPQHPMYVGVPGKRLQKSIAPTLVTDGAGRPIMAVGAAGVRTITQTIVQTIIHHLDLGMDPQAAIDAPRLSYENRGNKLNTTRIGDDTVADLRALGHDVLPGGWGRVQAITMDPATGVLKGGADIGGSAEAAS